MNKNLNKVSAAGLLIALGIIYGDIGTSPLYVFNAIIRDKIIAPHLILGGLSCIIWTLTLQTTLKYVILTLRADNKGEGGIFSLYALVRRQKKWLVFPAMIGGAALLADGMITPPISVTSAVEGLKQIHFFSRVSETGILYIVIGILIVLFFTQQFGTASIGKMFGPIMFIWFLMLTILGLRHVADHVSVLKAFNPWYAVKLLTVYPDGFWLLGAVFLCTTGAEALYSDLGHCGRGNIRISWIFVKSALIINYVGQGAWLLANHTNKIFTKDSIDSGFNAFYGIMPDWFKIIGIIIATIAAIIASQALISGSFTLISESIRLSLWPKMRIKYPSEAKGQLFIPGINNVLFIGCCGITLYFRSSSNMEAAYGLAITLCMISTSLLFTNYMISKRISRGLIFLYLTIYITLELSFLIANLSKFPHGGFVTLIAGSLLFGVMIIWFKARKIRNRYIEFVRLEHYLPLLQELSNDLSITKYSTHLVYLTSANNPKEIEHKIIYSILNQRPKRADIYWFVHVDTMDDPYTSEYSIETIVPNEIIRVEFRLGFRIAPRLNLMFRKVVKDMVDNREVNITSRYESLQKNNVVGDFQFVVLEKFVSTDNELPFLERLILNSHLWLKDKSLNEEKGFGLEESNVTIEKSALMVAPVKKIALKRIDY